MRVCLSVCLSVGLFCTAAQKSSHQNVNSSKCTSIKIKVVFTTLNFVCSSVCGFIFVIAEEDAIVKLYRFVVGIKM